MRPTVPMTHHLHPTVSERRDLHATPCVVLHQRGGGAVTAVRPQVAVPERADVPGPVPRRVRPPRWLDLRLVLGVLLVLGSVLVGARVLSSADATVPVWAASGDLAAGTALTADDVVAVDVRLDDAAGAY